MRRLLAVLATVFLAACGGSASTAPSSSATAATSAQGALPTAGAAIEGVTESSQADRQLSAAIG